MSYATDFYNIIERQRLTSFTHRDIIINTDANCPYSVLVALRALLSGKGLTLTEKNESRTNKANKKKTYKRYYIERLA